MAKVLRRLYAGDIVASSGTRRLRNLVRQGGENYIVPVLEYQFTKSPLERVTDFPELKDFIYGEFELRGALDWIAGAKHVALDSDEVAAYFGGINNNPFNGWHDDGTVWRRQTADESFTVDDIMGTRLAVKQPVNNKAFYDFMMLNTDFGDFCLTDTEIADLTNTAWRFKPTINLMTTNKIFYVNISAYGGSFSTLEFRVAEHDGTMYGLYVDGLAIRELSYDTTFDISGDFTITGGADATNPELIAWVKENAGKKIHNGTQGLAYTLNDDGVSYSCTGIGTATDTDIVIASEYEGLPVTIIRSSAFDGCSAMTSIKIPASVQTMLNFAFRNCTSLKTVTFADGIVLKRIEAQLFINCTSLTSIVLPSTINMIGTYAFQGCSSLSKIVIPIAVTYMGYYAFDGCDSLRIYAEASKMGKYWDSDWNPDNRPVVWGYTGA